MASVVQALPTCSACENPAEQGLTACLFTLSARAPDHQPRSSKSSSCRDRGGTVVHTKVRLQKAALSSRDPAALHFRAKDQRAKDRGLTTVGWAALSLRSLPQAAEAGYAAAAFPVAALFQAAARSA